MKDAHRHVFSYTPREGYLYVRSRAISSRTNDNFDTFPADEIKKAWASFVGRPVFVNHHNDDIRRKRGVIIDAALHEDIAPDGTPDTWVEVLMEIDAVRFPKLAAAILAGDIERTSMGCDVAESECSVCGNVARTPSDYCPHVSRMKGQRIRRRSASTGGAEDVLVHEICRGISFFENSLLVEPPADPTAFFLGVDDRGVRSMGLAKAAARKTAAAQYVMVSTGGGWELHIAGCSDINHPKYSLSTKDSIDADSAADALDQFLDEQMQSQGYTKSDVRVLPCARSGVPVAPKAADPNACPASGTAIDNPRRLLYMNCPECGKRLGTGRGMWPKHAPMNRSAKKKVNDWETVTLTDAQKERFKGTTVRKDDDGYFCHTHRARSDSYPSVDEIPAKDIKFIESTGAKHATMTDLDAYTVGYEDGRSDALAGMPPAHSASGDRYDNGYARGYANALRDRSSVPETFEPSIDWGTIAMKRTSANQETADAIVNAFPESLRPRAEKLKYRLVYGPDYDRNITENLNDALRFANWGEMDSAEYFMRKCEAKEVFLLGGEFIPAMHPGNPGQQQQMFSSKTAANGKWEYITHGDGGERLDSGTGWSAFLPDTDFNEPGEGVWWVVHQEIQPGVYVPYKEGVEGSLRAARTAAEEALAACPVNPEWERVKQMAREQASRYASRKQAGGTWDYGPTTPSRNAGTRWEDILTLPNPRAHVVICRWSGDEVAVTSGVFGDAERADEWAQMCIEAGAEAVEITHAGEWRKAASKCGHRHHAFGETTVPPKIDTLRLAECPVCGEDADWDGSGRCRTCGYIPPPEPFRDPDLEVAKRVDMSDGWINPDLAKAPPFEEPE